MGQRGASRDDLAEGGGWGESQRAMCGSAIGRRGALHDRDDPEAQSRVYVCGDGR